MPEATQEVVDVDYCQQGIGKRVVIVFRGPRNRKLNILIDVLVIVAVTSVGILMATNFWDDDPRIYFDWYREYNHEQVNHFLNEIIRKNKEVIKEIRFL